ncbi:MFS transporter [Nocardia transvalensis]|uniref:MFS transporter n=1 Tax=Nocardia transvalensis TaxID=37333 RepID=UPI001895DD56|nr:MFS transporter [Nocardia transvalensis]MBF6333234.1 MFS transporter [Nocardia transvalensis]
MPTRRFFVDLGPLRGNPAFARLWFGTSVSAVGGQLSSYAVLLQSWDMTHSAAAVGGTGLAVGVPRIIFAFFGGALSDRADRRRLVLISGLGLIAGSLALTMQSAAHCNSIWLLYLLAAVKAVLSSVAGPARATFVPSLLRPDQVASGVALNQLASQWSVFAGPTLAGWLTVWFGLTVCYALDTASYVASLYGVYRLPPLASGAKKQPTFGLIVDGVRHIASTPVIVGCLLADLCAMVLAYPNALLPALNANHFGGGPATLAYLISAMALGGFLSSVLSGWVTRFDRTGLLMVLAVMVWGSALFAVGLVGPLWSALALLVVAGAADTVTVVCKGIVVQLSTGQDYLGRVNAASQSIGVAGPALGNFRAGLTGSAFGAETAIMLGGLLSVCSGLCLLVGIPSIRRFSKTRAEAIRQPA